MRDLDLGDVPNPLPTVSEAVLPDGKVGQQEEIYLEAVVLRNLPGHLVILENNRI